MTRALAPQPSARRRTVGLRAGLGSRSSTASTTTAMNKPSPRWPSAHAPSAIPWTPPPRPPPPMKRRTTRRTRRTRRAPAKWMLRPRRPFRRSVCAVANAEDLTRPLQRRREQLPRPQRRSRREGWARLLHSEFQRTASSKTCRRTAPRRRWEVGSRSGTRMMRTPMATPSARARRRPSAGRQRRWCWARCCCEARSAESSRTVDTIGTLSTTADCPRGSSTTRPGSVHQRSSEWTFQMTW
mmetsp:Transcript_52855/g.113050  ORF Transcript_52855/g.113050 Transcript_52855/m.113050 type:complete len:241 (-) Transcript_52855:802-1524(-)